MLTIRKLLGSVFVAGAAAAIAAGPTAALLADAPATFTDLTGTNQVVLATPSGSGDAGGGGGCDSGPNWHGCGGWNPVQGGWGHGCINGICGGWDGQRGWGG
ncbi:hypothetical protein H7J87_09710 [Mycolicibacterium wolinskyi]|uniref:PE-PGRS family protein n=1 Tax=Mycolicibacterium wolinskyi TaxID=59750 RepID=A0A1X2FB97_9MYCO|nr:MULTISPECIES: hypothetical protein [Mycolicibacterium]MCV7285605.1 hypothetical protein [Mycolicibacterium wolinskyi]MCV7291364.1 hypothetical protein [Mycolicibacterium goodii]ORX15715.1 hypothetical protein AWC31_23535 [Mycolicibacterium wolinskyi]